MSASVPEDSVTVTIPISKLADVQKVLAPKKKRPAPKTKRDLRGLKPYEQDAVLKAALTFYNKPKSPGCYSGMTDERLYQLMLVFFNVGCHRKVMADPVGKKLTVLPTGGLYFQRAKKTGGFADTEIPVYEEMRPWMTGFVEWLRARGGIHWRMINEILAELGRRAKLSRPLNPLLCRHTAGTNLFRNGADALRIATWLNCSVKTAADHYCKTDAEDLEASLKKSGSFRMSSTV